jgi:hypothetical protein
LWSSKLGYPRDVAAAVRSICAELFRLTCSEAED